MKHRSIDQADPGAHETDRALAPGRVPRCCHRRRLGLWTWLVVSAILTAAIAPAAHAAATHVTQAWVQRVRNAVSNSWDSAATVVRDASGNIYVAGQTQDGAGSDILILKYSGSNGAVVWQQRQDGGFEGTDQVLAAAVDLGGNLIVAGFSVGANDADFYTAKFSATDGARLWMRLYDGPSHGCDEATSVAAGPDGSVVVTGHSGPGRWDEDPGYNADYYTAKYASNDGAILWERRYDGPGHSGDQPRAVAIDSQGHVVVAGFAQGEFNRDLYTARYAGADGALLWEKLYNGPWDWFDSAQALAVDALGNVVVAGTSMGEHATADIYTAKYAAADGTLLWDRRKIGSPYGTDSAQAVVVDGSGDVFVTGTLQQGTANLYTARYAAGDGSVLWEQIYNGPANGGEYARALALDPTGQVIASGFSFGTNGSHDFYTAAYDTEAGDLLWDRRYDGPAGSDDFPVGLTVDSLGRVVVTGDSWGQRGPDFYTAQYAPLDGALEWEQRYNSRSPGAGRGIAVAVDSRGQVVVTGTSDGIGGDADYVTAKYAPDGTLLWTVRYDDPGHSDDHAQALALDAHDNVVVTGYSASDRGSFDYYTAKYAAADGALLWEQRYDGPGHFDDFGRAVAIDADGDVVVTGFSTGIENNYDYYTAKYSGTDGVLKWERRFNSLSNGHDGATALAVDPDGNVVVTGSARNIYTIKYAAADGATLWDHPYAGPGSAGARALAIDGSGNVVVTGDSGSADGTTYYTAKYAAADGALLWERRFAGGDGVDLAWAVAVDAQGNAIVTGFSYAENGNGADAYTIKYAATDGAVVWAQRATDQTGGTSLAKSIAVDETGNVVVAGLAAVDMGVHDYFVAKYAASDGRLLWEDRYDGPVHGEDGVETRQGLALGPNGVVVLTGASEGAFGSSTSVDYTTVFLREGLAPVSLALVPGGVLLRFIGEPGQTYLLQRAPSVAGAWNTFATAIAPPDGLVEYLDATPLDGSAFYRTATP